MRIPEENTLEKPLRNTSLTLRAPVEEMLHLHYGQNSTGRFLRAKFYGQNSTGNVVHLSKRYCICDSPCIG